tara:strand:- start:1792 stop:1947 length:156 start_codon:yes stop_codon:yes gene_type:complete
MDCFTKIAPLPPALLGHPDFEQQRKTDTSDNTLSLFSLEPGSRNPGKQKPD